MKINETYHFEGFDLKGKKVSDAVYKNVITQLWFNAIFAYLNGGVTPFGVTHLATGSGINAASVSDTQLQTEVFRKAVSSKTMTTDTFITKLSLAASESAFNIKEVGLFCAGTGAANSGVLISRCNVDIVKNASTQYLITHTITIDQ